jgi:hypothetical protein
LQLYSSTIRDQSVKQLKPTRNLLLKHALRIILLTNSLQLRLLRNTVPTERILPRRGVVEVQVFVVQPQLLRLVFTLLEQVLSMLLDARIISLVVPRHRQEQVEQVAVGGSQAERVPASRSGFGRYGCGHGLEAQAVSQVRHAEGLHRAVGDIEDRSHHPRAVSIRPRDEQLAASTGRGRAGELESKVREVGDAHCAESLGEGSEILKDRGVDGAS